VFRVATGQEKVRENVFGWKIDILREIQGKLK